MAPKEPGRDPLHPIHLPVSKDLLTARIVLRDRIFASVPAAAAETAALRKRRRYSAHLPANVVGLGIAEKISGGRRTGTLCVSVFVAKKFPKAALSREHLVPPTVDGIPTDVRAVGHPRAFAEPQQARHRPCVGGISAGLDLAAFPYRYAGTLGGVFADVDSPESLCMLSNNHVLANENEAEVGSGVVQPATLDGGRETDRVGTLYRFEPLRFDNRRNWMDAAAGRFDSSAAASTAVLGLGEPTGVADPELQAVVRKSGRTTGVTEGIVRSMPFDAVNIGYQSGLVRMDDVMVIEAVKDSFSKPGDSGSLIMDAKGRLVGLLFAGSETVTFAIPIRRVLRKLRLRLATQEERERDDAARRGEGLAAAVAGA